MSADRVLRLTSLPAALQSEGFVPQPYRVIREEAVDGIFAAHQVNGGWHFYSEDTPRIAASLNLERLPFPARAKGMSRHGNA
jgi:hypothetical protein